MCDNRVINGETKNGGCKYFSCPHGQISPLEYHSIRGRNRELRNTQLTTYSDAEYCILRSEAIVRVPDHVDAAKYAPILCAGMAVYNSIRHMNIPVGETVAIQGLGGLGHLAIQYAARMGYRVVAISRGADKEKFARQLGAHEYIDTSKPKGGDDVGDALKALGSASLVVATAPTADSMTPLLKGLGILGKLLVLSVPGELTIDTAVMLKYGVSVQSWPCGHARDSEEAIAFTELQGIDCMIQKFSLDQAQEAYGTSLTRNLCLLFC